MDILLILGIFALSYFVVYMVGRFMLYSPDVVNTIGEDVAKKNAQILRVLNSAQRYSYESILVIDENIEIIDSVGSLDDKIIEEFKSLLYIGGVGTTLNIIEDIFSSDSLEKINSYVEKIPEIMFLGGKRWYIHSNFDNTLNLLYIYLISADVINVTGRVDNSRDYELDRARALDNVESYIYRMLNTANRENGLDEYKKELINKMHLLASRINGMNIENTRDAIFEIIDQMEVYEGTLDDFIEQFNERKFLEITEVDRKKVSTRNVIVAKDSLDYDSDIFSIIRQSLENKLGKEEIQEEILNIKLEYIKRLINIYFSKFVDDSKSYNRKINPVKIDLNLSEAGATNTIQMLPKILPLIEIIILDDESSPEHRFLYNKSESLTIQIDIYEQIDKLVFKIEGDNCLLSEAGVREVTNGRYNREQNLMEGIIVQDSGEVLPNLKHVLENVHQLGGGVRGVFKPLVSTTFICSIPIE